MYINECVIRLYKLTAGNWARGSVLIFSPGCAVASYCGFGLSATLGLIKGGRDAPVTKGY